MTARDNELLGEVHRAVVKLHERFTFFEETVRNHEADLNGISGNGEHPGIKARLLVVENLGRDYRRARTWIWGLIAAVAVAGLTTILGILF